MTRHDERIEAAARVIVDQTNDVGYDVLPEAVSYMERRKQSHRVVQDRQEARLVADMALAAADAVPGGERVTEAMFKAACDVYEMQSRMPWRDMLRAALDAALGAAIATPTPDRGEVETLASASPARNGGVPDGCVVVPRTATPEMRDAGYNSVRDDYEASAIIEDLTPDSIGLAYAAMIAAAPRPATPSEGEKR